MKNKKIFGLLVILFLFGVYALLDSDDTQAITSCESAYSSQTISVNIPADFEEPSAKEWVLQQCNDETVSQVSSASFNCISYCMQYECYSLFKSDLSYPYCTAKLEKNPATPPKPKPRSVGCPFCWIDALFPPTYNEEAWSASASGETHCQCITPPEPH